MINWDCPLRLGVEQGQHRGLRSAMEGRVEFFDLARVVATCGADEAHPRPTLPGQGKQEVVQQRAAVTREVGAREPPATSVNTVPRLLITPAL